MTFDKVLAENGYYLTCIFLQHMLYGLEGHVSKETLFSASTSVLPLERPQWKPRINSRFHGDWDKFSLWWENVNVSFIPVLSFIMIKQFILQEKWKREMQAVASFIACPVSFTRLWFSIMLLSAAVRRPSSIETNLSYSAFWFHSFSLSSLLLAYSFFTCDCQPVKVILNQSNPL